MIAACAGLLTATFALAGLASYAGQGAPEGRRPAGSGSELFQRNACLACHSIGGSGGSLGPALDGVRRRKTRDEIITWLKDPQAVKPGTLMPTYPLTEEERCLLADYLLAQD